MWLWVVIALVCLLLLLLLVLCIPFDLTFSVTINENPSYKLRLLWLFGLLDRELKKTEGKPKKKEKETRAGHKKERRMGFGTIYRMVRTKGLWIQLKQLVAGICRSLKIKELAANLKLGLDNPADTGLLFAIIGPINYLLSLLPYRITVSPSFDGDTVFDAYVRGIIRLWPILAIFALLKFVFSLPAMRVAGVFVVSRWKRA